MFSTAFNHSTSPVWKHAPKHHQVISTPSGPHLTCISPAIIGHQGTSFMASWIWWPTQMLQYATSNIIQKPKSVSSRPKSESQGPKFTLSHPLTCGDNLRQGPTKIVAINDTPSLGPYHPRSAPWLAPLPWDPGARPRRPPAVCLTNGESWVLCLTNGESWVPNCPNFAKNMEVEVVLHN